MTMPVATKWKIFVRSDKEANIIIYLHGDHCENILRKLSDITFSFAPIGIEITKLNSIEK